MAGIGAYERERLEEAVAVEESKAAEGPIEPYPTPGSLWDAEFDQQVRNDKECGDLYKEYRLVDYASRADKAPSDVSELKRRLWAARMSNRRREIWNDICSRRFYREHH